MGSQLTPDQRRLAERMSELSEQTWCAGWMDGLEFALWSALEGGPRTYGRLDLTDEHLGELRRLSDTCGGWIVFDDDSEETFLPLADWAARFEAWREGGEPGLR